MSATGPERPEQQPPTTPDAMPPAGAYPPPPGYAPAPLTPLSSPPPQRSRPPVLAALLAVVLVVLIGLAAGVLLFAGGEERASPTPTLVASSPVATVPATPTGGATETASPAVTATPATPRPATPRPATPTASAPPASPTPDGSPPATPALGRTPPPDVAQQIDAVVADVPSLRELEALRDVPYVLLTREEFQVELADLLAEEVDVDQLATEERLLKRLGLLRDDADLYELMVELYGSQVAAYYRPDTGTFYIIERDEPFGAMDRMIVAHEYVHALQDQHFDLEGRRITDPAEGDAAIAQLAAIEGDASLVMFLWAFEHLTLAEQLELFTGFSPAEEDVLADMPLILRRQLMFPYSEGLAFSSDVQRRGGWQAINDTLSEPPASTEQVLHPEKYAASEAPVRVRAPHDLLGALGAGWETASEQTMGELNLQIWLAEGAEPPLPGIPAPPEPWQEAADGWGGDRLWMYENDAGDWAIVWHTAWDSESDAEDFEALAEDLLPTLDGPAQLMPGREGPEYVTLFAASNERILAALTAPEYPARYIDSGADMPSRPSAEASVTRVASTSARRAAEVAGWAGSTTRRSR